MIEPSDLKQAYVRIAEQKPGETGDAYRARLRSAASDAAERADAAELYVLHQRALDEADQTMRTLSSLAAHYVGEKGEPRSVVLPPSEDAVSAMERVSLAAIDLAKTAIANAHSSAQAEKK